MGKRRLAVLLLAPAVAVTLAAAARAQDPDQALSDAQNQADGQLADPASTIPDPYATGEQLAKENDLDTDHTPNAKETSLFQLIAGTAWEEAENDPVTRVIPGSPTSFDDNLYTVAFSEQQGVGGFAGGATCEDPEPGKESGCRPAIYEYRTFEPTRGPEWRRVELPGGDRPGYVGAIAWISRSGKALAVGGTGIYPRRELGSGAEDQFGRQNECGESGPRGCSPTDPRKADVAGEARAWLYENGGWEEITGELPLAETQVTLPARQPKAISLGPGQDVPPSGSVPPPLSDPDRTVPRAGMRGLTALACDPFVGRELCLAGGLGQLWTWRDGRFAAGERFDALSPNPSDQGGSGRPFPARFRFRVRDIEFVAGDLNPQAFAVTSGCCAPSEAENTARVLGYWEGEWYVRTLMQDPRDTAGNALATQGGDAGAVGQAAQSADGVNLHPLRPDSYYSLTTRQGGSAAGAGLKFSAIATPGGPERPGEPPSIVTPRRCITPRGPEFNPFESTVFGAGSNHLLQDVYEPLTRVNLSTARLVAGDGDVDIQTFMPRDNFSRISGSPATFSHSNANVHCAFSGEVNFEEPDSVADWVVGELRSARREGAGRRGLLLANPLRPDFVPTTVDPSEPALTDVAGLSWEPTSAERLQMWARAQYFLLPSYGLNSIDVIGDSASAWAVGDHGAILRLDAEQLAKAVPEEPPPPRVGARRVSEPADSGPYDGLRPDAAPDAGPVPALSARPPVELAEPRLVPYGSAARPSPALLDTPFPLPQDVSEIAVSRDGAEGWAVGGASGETTLHHYDGSAWSPCEFFGIEAQLPPDPACEEIARIRRFVDAKGSFRSAELLSISRVPLERDADPTNDDEFEAVAVGSMPQPGGTSSPVIVRYRDGRWRFEDPEATAEFAGRLERVAFTAPDDGWSLGSGGLFHFDGERWISCVNGSECHDERVSGMRNLFAAGERVYMWGVRPRAGGRHCLAIVYRKRGESTWRGTADGSDGSFDPGFGTPAQESCPEAAQIELHSVAVGVRADGRYEGWAVGVRSVNASSSAADLAASRELGLLRLTADGRWNEFEAEDALADAAAERLSDPRREITLPRLQAMAPRADGGLEALLVPEDSSSLLRFDEPSQRWKVVASDRLESSGKGIFSALAPDGQGGVWAAFNARYDYFFRYTDHPRQEPFAETVNPLDDERTITAAAPGPGGTFWVATGSERLYRYDRALGWDLVRINGWDPGRVVTRASRANAIAINEQGVGVVVGEGGRIAGIAGDRVQLDRAAGTLCDPEALEAPCGTGRDLLAASVAPDGSAMVGGEGLSLLWRPPGGELRAIDRPDAASQAAITAISMPAADRAWLTTRSGFVFAGQMGASGRWTWTSEALSERGDPLTLTEDGSLSPLRAIAVDPSGAGLAVGAGVVLERTGGDRPWRRLRAPVGYDDLTSIALPPQGGTDGALVGGMHGLILTKEGTGLEVARHGRAPSVGETHEGRNTVSVTVNRPVVGLALLGGVEPGQTEAWAAVQGGPWGDSALLHYASDPSEPLLDGARRAVPLPDTLPPRPDELALATFGNTRCTEGPCSSMQGGPVGSELWTRRIVAEIAARASRPGGPEVAMFSGDMSDRLTGDQGQMEARRWTELVAEPLEEAGVALYGALGGGDLARPRVCFATCANVPAGDSWAWRRAMSDRRGPWGQGGSPPAGELSFEPVADSSLSARPDELTGEDEAGADLPATPAGAIVPRQVGAPLGGASTHYAVDLVRSGGPVARLVVVDTSLGSLSASDPAQYPVELRGQIAWLEEVLCTEGSEADRGDGVRDCTREPGQEAIVVSNAPSYSYGPGQGETQVDSTVFEQILLENDASLVVSGRIGWNGRYWATAPGVHVPCPGGEYMPDSEVPERGSRECASTGSGEGQAVGSPEDTLAALDAAGAGEGPGAAGALAFVVASGAGRFAPEGSGSAPDGFWHGYTVVRVPEDGDPRGTIVEQRPVFDWLRVSGRERVIRPRKRLSLLGVGREPIAREGYASGGFIVRYDEISNAAITHRYDLLAADPDRPWLPKRDDGSEPEVPNAASLRVGEADPCGRYVCLDPKVGTIDEQSGQVRAGRGDYPRTYAVASLSVDDQSATYPLVFEPRASYQAPPARPAPPAPP
ncbi:MAG: hypothetical protein ACRDL6_07755, partial [Solirubrobacterales bacterium]